MSPASGCSSGQTSTSRSTTARSPTTRGSAPRANAPLAPRPWCRGGRRVLAPRPPEDGRGPRAALDRPCRGAPAEPAPRSDASACSRTRASIPARRATIPNSRASSPTAWISTSTTHSARPIGRTARRRAWRILLPAYAGLLLLAELDHLGRLLGEVERPFVLVAGGAKVDDKLGGARESRRTRRHGPDRRQDGRAAA